MRDLRTRIPMRSQRRRVERAGPRQGHVASHPRRSTAESGASLQSRLAIHACGKGLFLSHVHFDLLRISVIVSQGGVNLREAEMTPLSGDLLGSQPHPVPPSDADDGYVRSGDLGPARSDLRIAIDQASNF